MPEVAEQIEQLSPAKRALLARLIAEKRAQSGAPQPITRRAEAQAFPLSFSQERLWFLDRLLPGNPMYNMAGVARLSGPLDQGALVAALSEIVRRHEVLRTVFTAADGQPVPVVTPPRPLAPQVFDLRGLPAEQREAEARRLMAEEARRPFDLAAGPLLRMTLLRLEEQECLGLLTMHHIVSDGWSTRVLFEELGPLYAARAAGRPAPLPELAVQYGDYALWQRGWLQGAVLEQQLGYWRERLAGPLPVLELPADRPRPASPSLRGARVPVALAPELTAALARLASEQGATLFMALLAGLDVLLARYSGQEDVIVGSPIAGRNRPEVAGLIGCFLNMLVLRCDLSGGPTFRELLGRVKETALGAYAHQDLPFERLVDALQPDRSTSHTPLFQVAFSFEESPTEAAAFQGLTLRFEELDTATSKVDLSVELTTERGGLAGWFEYSTDLFEAATVERMARHFAHLLERAAAEPDRPIAELALLPEDERRRVLADWNATERPYPLDKAIHALFEAQAARTPEATALVCGAARLSYRELNTRADWLAHRLRALGVEPDQCVGLCLPRSPELIVGVLGVLKAGGAYLPLDPAYPDDRLAFMLADAAAPVLLTSAALAAERPALLAPAHGRLAPRLLCIDTPADEAADAAPAPRRDAGPANLAYVIYTSGSTGRPKGVMVDHAGLVNHTLAFVDNHDLDAGDRVLQFASLSFDAAAATLFPPLVVGGAVVLPEVSSSELLGARLADLCEEQRVTVVHLPASVWHQWVDELAGRGRRLRAPLKVLLVGGEKPAAAKLRAWLEIAGRDMIFLNAYGPTEAVITTTIFRSTCAEAAALQSVPAGRPLPNKQVYLLDARLQPVPAGVPGELYVGGAGLARGYLGRPDLTAERFVPNPFGDERRTTKDEIGVDSSAPLLNSQCSILNSRLYRTGDLARWLPDGQIEFIGRADRQVKLRGFRIELSEIEAALRQHAAVRECVVLAREDTPGDKRLVAYVVPTDEGRRTKDEGPTDEGPTTTNQQLTSERTLLNSQFSILNSQFREHLAARLPAYMVPAAFVALEALPLTGRGKLDLAALPAPGLDALAPRAAFVAPRTREEQTVAAIWARALGVAQVGVHDNFFDLGGHSLLATRIVADIQAELGADLPLRLLFDRPTVAGLAAAAAGRADVGADTALPAIVPAPEQWHLPFPLNDIQQAYWIGRSDTLDLGNVACHGYVEFESVDLDLERLNRAWRRLIDRHGMLRAVMLPDGRQRILPEVPPYLFAAIDLRGLPEELVAERLAALREELSHQVLDAERWPLFDIRATLLDGRRTRLHASVDLLIADARSFQVLLLELALLYQTPETELAPLELSFRDYIVAEEALRGAPVYQRSLDYWLARLPELPPAPDLPLAKDPSAISRPRFVRRSGRLEADAWERLKRRAAQASLTPSGVLLAAFAEVLTTWSKSQRFTINLTMFNRLPLHPQVNDIFGDFTSLTLLAVDNTAADPFEARARRVQQQLWDDLDHRHIGGVRVQRELMRLLGGAGRALMPVVFTSTLTLDRQSDATFPDWLGEIVYSIGQTPQVWLDHQVFEERGALAFNWDAVEELFPEGMIEAMFATYCAFLHGLAAEEQPWRQVRCPAPAQQRALYDAANATDAPVPEGLLHTLFAAQVPLRAACPAVITRDRSLTYAELDRRANQVGGWLRAAGARPNTLVAVVMQKGWEQVVAALGVLASGAAYLPIDAAMPAERMRYVLEHGQVELALTQPWLDGQIDWPAGLRRLVIDDATLEPLDAAPLAPVQTPADLAYVIYTSGSTGLPKGVMIDHRGAVNTIVDVNERCAAGPDDRVLALSSLSFDLSVYDIFGLLAAGGALVIPPADAGRDPAQWAELVRRERVTLWNSVPALVGMLVEYAAGRGEPLPPSLRAVMLSGDWIPLDLPGRIRALLPDARLISMGGATEASIWSILYPIEELDPAWRSVPYGKAMKNQRFYVLDEALEPRPVGVEGALYIGGIGLAKGYWRDSDKTAASFITHPRTGEPLYRTGDIGCYLPDGNIEFLGRADFQVKIQGYRIELGEIEAALTAHPQVRAAVVAALGAAQSSRRLVAYVVPDDQRPTTNDQRPTTNDQRPTTAAKADEGRTTKGEQPAVSPDVRNDQARAESASAETTGADRADFVLRPSSLVVDGDTDFVLRPSSLVEELRRHLAGRLPAYMVPSAFVLLDALPLSANGKVDRKQLPDPEQAAPAAPPPADAAPRSPLEAELCTLAAEVLEVARIGIYDSFFELGGNSLQAVQLITRVRQRFGVELPLRDLFESPTVAGLASCVEAARWLREGQPELAAVGADGREEGEL